ncbi:MAG: helix-turn-helix domain-containing protein [Saprospiraceae bacterium]
MIQISILALKNAVMATITDSRYVFQMVNEFLIKAGKQPMFEIKLVGLSKEVELDKGLYTLHPECILAQVDHTDLIIIPSLIGNTMSSTNINKDYILWIARQYKNGAAVASLGVGIFLTAFAGILKGKEVTTHWHYAHEFRHFYPSTKLVEEKIFTEQQGIYSSGGGISYWNLLLYLVEKYAGRQIAIYTAKYFVLDLDRHHQSPFAVFNGTKDHDDPVILIAQEFIEQNYKTKLGVDQLAALCHLTRRTFERRFKKATYLTVIEYIQRVKIEAAKKHLEIGRKSVYEIMSEVGYTDMQTFRTLFKRITDMTPLDYRNKYNQE